MDYVKSLENKDQFTQGVKNAMREKAFGELERMKKEIANDFLKSEE